MFKLESYITPILLSYVDKYIKNFRPEDSQVSLWGGDASFHNLDLRLDVLEEELQLPFNLVSGHIHELLIHVPWTKLASEPINITINTIECVLKLRGSYSPNADNAGTSSRERKRKSSQSKKQEIAAPPGYVQSLINKIVNNITINCNNLILKYVEEDIVISVNIKMLTFQSADGEWQPAFTEISPTQMIMRKLITLSDLTICLDKRNAAGKIEVYQEPILYRCSIEIRFLKQFYSSNSDKTLNTRIDVHCNRMEFSMTEQQIPMLLRIINLAIALQQRQLKKHTHVENAPGSFGTTVDEANANDAYGESWAGWAWSFAANIFPTEDESNLEWNNMNHSESSLQCGVYIDNVIFTFKVSEYYSNDKGYYATRKVKYWPLLCLQLNGCYSDTVILGVEWTSFQMGIAEAILLPQGCCSCGLTDVTDDTEAKYYLKTGTYNGNHLMNSLFDPNIMADSPRRYFTISWDYYLNTISEAVLLEKTSAFAIDFLYHLEVPDDFSSEKLSEFENDLEYSNLVEKSICRIVAGPSVTNVCSGLIHRISTLYEVMKSYDYPPYVEPPIEPKLTELHPPSEDDFDSLSNLIPKRIYQVTFLKPVFQIDMMDHPKFVPSKRDLFRKLKKNSGYFVPSTTCPCITLECETIDVKIIIPMYPKRLIYTTCQLPEPPDEMFNSCYFHSDVNITGFSSQMIFNTDKKTTILLPFNVSCTYKSIMFPNYWINPEINHKEIVTEIDSITLTATKAKLMVIFKIIERLIAMDVDEYKCSIYASSLLQDAPIDAGMVVLELYTEQIKWRTIKTISTESHKISLDSLRAFALEPSEFLHEQHEINHEPNQVLIVSGPENSETKTNMNNSLLTLTLQFPLNAEKCVHPPIIFFNLEEMKICFDPLFFQWFFYCPKTMNVKQDSFWPTADNLSTYKPRALSDMSGTSLQETPRRVNTPHESIHSSSEREQNVHLLSPRAQYPNKQPVTINSDNIYYDFLMKWYLVWTNIIVYGDIKSCTIYFPKQSLPAIGSQGIEDAINMSLKLEKPIEIMVVKLPSASIRTSGQKQSLTRYTSHLPVTLPNTIWTCDKQSFPWTIEIKNFCCYTLQNKTKLFFLKPISGNITMSLSIKYRNADVTLEPTKKHVSFESKPIDNISSFSVYVHIDNTPIEIALSEIQVCLISSILLALYEVLIKLFPSSCTSSIDEKCRSKEDTASVLRKSLSRSQSPTIIKDDFHDTISEKTPTSIQTEIKNIEEDTSEIKFIVWLQWTITRLRIKLFGYNINNAPVTKPTLKLVFELEDIMTSLDLQQIYSKFKLKIVTAGILHYKRSSSSDDWKPGDYLGTVMRSREELPSTEKQDDFGFMSVTITKAKCGHVHSKWGTSKKHRLAEMKMEQQSSKENLETRYISEVVATIQPIDFIVSAKVLKSFYMILEPILKLSISSDPSPKTKTDRMALLNNSNIPLAYLDCHGVRLVVVSSTNESTGNHDICIIEIENINLVPTAENPICRKPIRPDIYQRAAQARILNVPGSNIEDRQYQINMKSLSVNTGAWIEFKQVLMRDTSVISSLHTMNENPALEWNNLEWGQSSLTPNLSLLPIVQKFDECIVVAPAILCPTNGLICGCSLELNCISDIEIFISLQQFRLISILTAEFINFVTPNETEILAEPPAFTYFNQKYIFSPDYKKNEEVSSIDYAARDSGNDTMDVNSEITLKTKESFSVSDRRNILKLTSESKNSDLKYTSSHINYCPTEILITGGNISLSLYKITNEKFIEKKNIYSPEHKHTSPNKDDAGYDGSEEESIDVPVSAQKVQPLLYILISQLNFYLSDNTFEKKINFSCFDVYIKTNESKHTYIMGLPTPKDYQIYILETKSGIPNPGTGIPPAFITFKWSKSIGKPLELSVDFGRPIRIFYSLEKLNHLLYLKEHILENTIDLLPLNVPEKKPEHDEAPIVCETFVKYKKIKDTFKGIQNFTLKVSQIVFVCKTTLGAEMTFSWESCASFLGFLVRPERITNTLTFKGITITTNIDDSTHFLLNPWSLTLKSNFFWESWQGYNSDAQTQILIDNDCFNVDIGPEQLKCVTATLKELNDLQEMFDYTSNDEKNPTTKHLGNIERDQYYKDDLRAGAFQFVDATSTTDPNELPLPYQVMFWNGQFAAMAWRYPQPRILAKVRVFPVPFKITNERSKNQQVLCFLEYWSECHGTYKSVAQFHLSESEMYYLELPTNVPQIAVSCTWRVVLTFSDSRLQLRNNHFVSARALAACMRVDSYFNSILIPRLQFAVNCFNINVSFYNQFNKKLALIMPKKLRNYTPDGLIPDNHCFLIINAAYTNMHGACWCSNVSAIELKTNLKCSVLDYASLLHQPILEPVNVMFNLTLEETINLNAITGNINVTFSPAIAHTLAVSSQLWTQNWLKNTNEEPPDMIIITRYVICNDTNVKIRFGQTNTDENILLPSRFLHLYCWRSQSNRNRSIRIGVEQNHWKWSKPINIDTDRIEYINVSTGNNCCLIVTIKTLSATQKQIIFSGQLVICNMLLDQFELKVLPYNEANKDLALKNAERHIVQGKTTAPTILIDTDVKLALRLRFLSLESTWSGDIPLEENTKGSQPWLVKIPLQERGQFLSIWCRVIDRKHDNRQILVMLWPLFMLRSNLPVKTHVFVETSALNVRLETNLTGRGELQQLYCPGTIDHSHNLIFDLKSSTSPHIPINYSLIDHKEIFKKIEKDDIFDILDYLSSFDEIKWPYIDNNLDTLDLSCDVQPVAHVQTIYRNVCKYSSSLLVELIPWCLLINTLGVPISIIIKGNETLKVKHYGVVTPPKLENTFNVGVEIDDINYISPLLQLAKADWSQSFYMPKINGIIPLEGNIKIPVKCDLQMCMMSITSSVVNNLRILQISSKYIVINHTKLQLEVTCIALPPNNNKIYDVFDFSQSNSILLEPHLDKKNIGVPLTTWNCVEDISDTVTDYSFHLIISLENKFAQSSPIQIDNGLSRKCICLYSHTENIPLVLIAQEHKGQIYLSIHPDIHPQLLIKNKCSQQIFCAQHDATTNDNPYPVTENHYIHWICNIYSDTECYYTMSSVSESFPNVDGSNTPEKLILAVKCEDVIPSYQWSQEINISIFNEQYVRIPQYGDIKLSIKKSSATIIVTIDSVTEVEISAQDIRSRLLMQSTNTLHDHKSNLTKSTSQYEIRERNHAIQNIKSDSNIPENSSRFLTDFPNIDKHYKILKNCHLSSKDRWSHVNLAVVLKNVVLSLAIDNQENSFDKINLTNIICDYVGVTVEKKDVINCSFSVANIQCDNQLFNTGSYDFPVILKGENSNLLYQVDESNREISSFIDEIKTGADIIVDLRLEVWEDKNIQQTITEIQEIKVKFGPLSLYIEDSYITKLIEYLGVLSPPQLVLWSIKKKPKTCNIYAGMVKIPEYLSWESKLIAKPLYLQNLSIEPMTLLLSLHSSVKLYIALDRSPLQFNKFERKNLTTTPYRLGQALTMHYLSDAIFGAGWVVGSLELLGSPSGLARTVGSGLRDFISLPYNGLIQGPWAFLVGITHGSASLMRHITAGTLDSVTKLASSVARNLDRLTLDAEHQKRTEELRRQRPQGLAQGFLQGLTGLGISLLGAVGGIAHHSLQSVMNDGATPRGLVAGVGLGLVGVFTKPLSGAAELVALTGQGLLQGAGWNPLPEPRAIKTHINSIENSILKYTWKVLQNTATHKFIAIIQVDFEHKPILLIVSFDALILIDIAEDVIKRVVAVSEINDVVSDGLMEIRVNLVQPIKPPPQNAAEAFEIEMDPVSRARIADYVKNSAGLVQLSPLGSNSSSDNNDSGSIQRPVISLAQPCLVFRVNSPIRNYLCDILELVRQQNRNNTFKIL